jgi:hypothetical protein
MASSAILIRRLIVGTKVCKGERCLYLCWPRLRIGGEQRHGGHRRSLRFRKAARLWRIVVPQPQVEGPRNNDVWAMGTSPILSFLAERTCELCVC